MSRNFLLFALLLLTGCSTLTPIETPTASPTFTPAPTLTPTPTPMPTLTPTPDPFPAIVNGLKDKGINASHEGGHWKIFFQGVEVPGTSMDRNGLHIVGVGDTPLNQMDRLVVNENGVLILNGLNGKAEAAFNPALTGKWGGWKNESDVISGNPDVQIEIGDSYADFDAFTHAEEPFLQNIDFPPDANLPPADQINKDPYYPLGILDEKDLAKMPFRFANHAVFNINGRVICMLTEAVHNDDGTISGLHFPLEVKNQSECGSALRDTRRKAGRMRDEVGVFILPWDFIPKHMLDKSDDLPIFKEFYEAKNLLDKGGNLDIRDLEKQWFNKHKVPDELTGMFLLNDVRKIIKWE